MKHDIAFFLIKWIQWCIFHAWLTRVQYCPRVRPQSLKRCNCFFGLPFCAIARLYEETTETIILSVVTYNTLIDVPLSLNDGVLMAVICGKHLKESSLTEKREARLCRKRAVFLFASEIFGRLSTNLPLVKFSPGLLQTEALVQSGALKRAMELFHDMTRRNVGLLRLYCSPSESCCSML